MQNIDVTDPNHRQEIAQNYSDDLLLLVHECLAVDTEANPAGNNTVRLSIDELRQSIDDLFADANWRNRLETTWQHTDLYLDEPESE